MAMNNIEFSVSFEIVSDNEAWQGVMEEGMAAPYVSGGLIDLPQGGKRESEAAITGGFFEEGSENSTVAKDNAKKMVTMLLPELLKSYLKSYMQGGSLQELENTLSDIARSEYQKIKDEFEDNPDEEEATRQVIESLHVKIEIEGLPTYDEIKSKVRNEVSRQLNALGGRVL